ncbi:TetR/AcrR family transcriptional regulator [Actinomadura madurae]|uniref:TetR/AcrR family transcriptional regulator n=1 Tax=Actinomadura madurae TaxID=1993 RepID=UPI0020271DD2|nr:TetR/AcrR family transcriptional regulator [Actinomadura madurae]MCP9954560.1 TetR/AcrR family transcriptional regulator [Actinomadura madurae]MCP9971297.1 TetR/AcrR family transcriptional regulator [Actinomadura madurae]MCP9983786.1 TetR/AcrR family transcriptional regulator [Actinomadura madurae]MCQ0004648.1 TetR/AcrR family transcriptional regulator [Actinomadura madurae]MCQ0020027.1 TetR/AcrR family transcriptional regulator [Actinomadura madurae]
MAVRDRPLTPAARRVLQVASELFYERGIGSVGMELIAAEAGVTKKTVYDRFGSKDALILAYLHARDERWHAFIEGRLSEIADPRERVLATFDALGEWLTTKCRRGCSMVNACAELPEPSHPVHRLAAEQKAWVRALYAEQVGDGALADQLLILHEGAVVAFSVGGVHDATGKARAAAAAILPATLSAAGARTC